ncbi:MAG: hypothetical protein ACE367_14360 [Acidimicrobiales bacterium]
MHIDRIAARIIDRFDHRPGDVELDHPYRHRWWLSVIGPTATVLLDHLTAIDTTTGKSTTHAWTACRRAQVRRSPRH